ncbi:MAG: hypothetical protein LAP40_05020 [Acidobacteriia bacterium]|nr:hypothetical protein [Terriglobia bacterium]
MKTFFRTVSAALLLMEAGLAGPPLTTIQDVIYKADGTRFTGMLTISWNGFEASDRSAIATQMVTVKVVDGNLRVKLVPNTSSNPPGFYSVAYNSDGRVQFTESWAVPDSPLALRLREVRVTTPPVSPQPTPIQMSDVAGLTASLDLRPMKAAGYAAGRVLMVNPPGTGLDSVTGQATDCVRVDGTSAPCGGGKTWSELMTTTWDSLR